MNIPKISLCCTMYNNRWTIENCLFSLMEAVEGHNYEVIVIDNYSTDGSYEFIKDKFSNFPIKVFRYKCSRGMGRTLAAEKSTGDFIITIDLDTQYDSLILRTVLSGYLKSKYAGKKCLSWPSMHFSPYSEGMEIYPREILLNSGGWRDLNRAEDNDLLARLHSDNLIITLPIEGAKNERIEAPTAHLEVLFREKRYAKGYLNQFNRLFRSSRDLVCGNAFTLHKTVVAFRYASGQSLHKTLFMCVHNFAFGIICRIQGMYFNSFDDNLSNGLYIIYRGLLSSVNPLDFGLEPERIINYDLSKSKKLFYLAENYDEIKYALDKIANWRNYHP